MMEKLKHSACRKIQRGMVSGETEVQVMRYKRYIKMSHLKACPKKDSRYLCCHIFLVQTCSVPQCDWSSFMPMVSKFAITKTRARQRGGERSPQKLYSQMALVSSLWFIYLTVWPKESWSARWHTQFGNALLYTIHRTNVLYFKNLMKNCSGMHLGHLMKEWRCRTSHSY